MIEREVRVKLLISALAAATLAACSGPAPDTRSDGNMTSAGSVENSAMANAEIVPPDETAPETAADDAATNNMAATPDYTGRWKGVEGMYLDVKSAGEGRYTLAMQWDLDNKGIFEGTAQGDAIVFDRKGTRETLRPTDGDATGLKYLAGKTDCLTVRTGEGYCRD